MTFQIPDEKAEVTLVGRDGNAFMIMGLAKQAMQRAGYSKELVAQYMTEATSGDYDNLLAVTMRYCDVS